MNDLVSVIIPNYNGSKFLERCVQSVLDQTYTNWEVFVIDDCSADNSKAIIERFAESSDKISAVYLTENSGPAVARNKGIELANGNFIAFLDSDDFWKQNKLEVQLEFMKSNNYALAFSSYTSVNEEFLEEKYVEARQKIDYSKLLTRNYIGCLTAMYDVQKIGKQYFPLIKKRQDWALWLKITKKGINAYGIQQPLAIYTRRNSSVSSNKLGLLKYNWKVYRELEGISYVKSLYLLTILVLKKIINK